MIKILILCENNKLIKEILNSVVVITNNLKLTGISNTIGEAKALMLRNKPDFIITTNQLIIPEVNQTFTSHAPKTIFITKRPQKSTKRVMYVDANWEFSQILMQISKILKRNVENSKKELVTNLLIDFGFDFKISGTPFLLDAILYKDTYDGNHCLEKLVDVYSHVAQMHNTSLEKVTWAINRSVEYMYAKHTKYTYANIEKYFRIKYPEKITPKLVINLISSNLKN